MEVLGRLASFCEKGTVRVADLPVVLRLFSCRHRVSCLSTPRNPWDTRAPLWVGLVLWWRSARSTCSGRWGRSHAAS